VPARRHQGGLGGFCGRSGPSADSRSACQHSKRQADDGDKPEVSDRNANAERFCAIPCSSIFGKYGLEGGRAFQNISIEMNLLKPSSIHVPETTYSLANS
jgi:hypothetical protein